MVAFALMVGQVPCVMSTLMIVQSCPVSLEETARTLSTTSRVNVPMDLEEKDARLKLICAQTLNVSMETALISSIDTSKWLYILYFH